MIVAIETRDESIVQQRRAHADGLEGLPRGGGVIGLWWILRGGDNW